VKSSAFSFYDDFILVRVELSSFPMIVEEVLLKIGIVVKLQ
jgi:hypothetical protein